MVTVVDASRSIRLIQQAGNPWSHPDRRLLDLGVLHNLTTDPFVAQHHSESLSPSSLLLLYIMNKFDENRQTLLSN